MTTYINEVPAFWPSVLGVDIETTDLDPLKGKILSIQFSDGKDSWVFLHTHGFKGVLGVLQDPNIIKIIHYAKFEAKFFKHCFDIDIQNVYCTMLAEQVIDGGRSTRDVHNDLQDVLARRLGIMIEKETQKTFIDHPGFHVQPITPQQITYMVNDVIYLPQLRELQMVELTRDNLLPTAQLEFECVLAFACLELKGMRLDVDLWYEYAQWYTDQIEVCNTQMRGIVGDFVIKVPGMAKKQPVIREHSTDEINLNSPKQMEVLLFQRFGLHVPNTDAKKTLRPILNGEILSDVLTDEGRQFIETLMTRRTWEKYRGWNFPKHINAVTGKVHPKFNQIGADTGRVSCSNPNVQQIPRPVLNDKPTALDGWQRIYSEPNLRHLFLPDEDGLVLARVDYSQQEPRIFAHMSQDQALIQACNALDVYITQAKIVYGYDVAKDSEERQIVKSMALAILYGAGVETLHKSSNRPIPDCARIRDTIKNAFPVAAAYATKMENFLRRNQYVTTALGRRRYIMQNTHQYAQAVNAPIQGTGADLFKMAFKNLHKTLTNEIKCGNISPKTRVYHLVHDELVVQIQENELDIVVPIVKKIMEDAGKEICPSVLHLAESKYGKTWDK